MKYVYPAIFEKYGEKIEVTVPDLPCYTFGDDMADAIEMAEDAAAMMLAAYEDEGKKAPEPSAVENVKAGGVVSLIVADTDAWRAQFDNRAVKKTLTIPAWLNKRAELAGINFSQVLQESLRLKLQ